MLRGHLARVLGSAVTNKTDGHWERLLLIKLGVGQTTTVTSPGADLSGRNKREAVCTIPEVHSCCWEAWWGWCLVFVRACVCVCVCVDTFTKFIVDTDDASVQRKITVDIVNEVQAETRGVQAGTRGTGRHTGVQAETRGLQAET